jgi:hypothetical protein
MLWSLFEARILNNSGNANRICATVASWREPASSASALRKCVVCSASVPIGRYGTCVYVGTRCREPSKSIGWWGTTIAESAHEDPNFDISVPSPRVRAIVLENIPNPRIAARIIQIAVRAFGGSNKAARMAH